MLELLNLLISEHCFPHCFVSCQREHQFLHTFLNPTHQATHMPHLYDSITIPLYCWNNSIQDPSMLFLLAICTRSQDPTLLFLLAICTRILPNKSIFTFFTKLHIQVSPYRSFFHHLSCRRKTNWSRMWSWTRTGEGTYKRRVLCRSVVVSLTSMMEGRVLNT
jgi:hypothetical protein